MLLVRLAGHYYRADFTPEQALAMIEDMVLDLSEYAVHDVEQGIAGYRRDPRNKFFPKSGELREASERARSDRLAAEREAARPPSSGKHNPYAHFEFGDSRPLCWENQRRRFWKPHWHEDDLNRATDPDRRARYDKWRARIKAGELPQYDPKEY